VIEIENSTPPASKTSSILQRLAETHRLHLRLDPNDFTEVIRGRHGEIYTYSERKLAVLFSDESVRR
jgi:hypothetical protein